MITADGRYTGVLTGTFTVRAASREKPSVADSARVGVWESGDELVALVVAPDSAVIEEGESVNFQAALRMARGALTGSAAVNWSASGGEMSPSGRFTAAEAGEYVISALSVNNLRASARVFVRKRILQLRRVSSAPASATMKPNRDTTFSATAEWSNGSVSAAAVDWSSTGGTVNYAGVYRSGGSPGDFVVVATDRATGLADTSRVAVVPPSLTRVTVSPKTLSLAPGAHQQFVAQAQLDDGTWGNAQVVWEASGGQVTQSGGFTAPSTPGAYRVIVSSPTMSMYGGVAAAAGSALADTAMVTVVQPAATLTSVTINPSSVVIQAGGQRSFSAIGTWSDGSTSVPAVTWTATGGTVDASGNYTAGVVPGSFRVIATAPSGPADTSNVTITGAVPVSLALTPETAALQSGQSIQFNAIATMSTGGSSAPAVTYSAQGGTISAGGLYTAGGSSGTYTVIATLVGGGLAYTSRVTIAPAPPVLT